MNGPFLPKTVARPYLSVLTTRAGLPISRTLSGTSRKTTAPAATILHLPILMPGMTTAPAPTWLPSPTKTPPHNVALGEI